MTERNLRNRTVSAPENDESESTSHALSEILLVQI